VRSSGAYLVEESLRHRLALVIDRVLGVDGPGDPITWTRACAVDTLREVDATCCRGLSVGPAQKPERRE